MKMRGAAEMIQDKWNLGLVARGACVERFRLPIVWCCLLSFLGMGVGCSSSRIYQGRVVFADTGLPVVGEEVCGSWQYRTGLSPSLDGLFTHGGKERIVKTDDNGRWAIEVEGFSRQLVVLRTGYERVRIYVDDWPRDKEVLILLVPLGRETEE